MSDEQFEESISKKDYNRLATSISIHITFTDTSTPTADEGEGELPDFAEAEPALALDTFLFAQGIRQAHFEKPIKLNTDSIIQAALKSPGSLLRSPGHWGMFFSNKNPPLEHQARQGLCLAIMQPHVSLNIAYYGEPTPSPFELKLPDEQALLIPIANTLLALPRDRTTHSPLSKTSTIKASDHLKTLAIQYVPDIAKLDEPIMTAPPTAALAAIVLGALHPSGGLDFLLAKQQRIADCIKSNPPNASVIPATIDLLGAESIPAVRTLLATILSQTYESYEIWGAWEHEIRNWRERSYAPVTQSRSERQILLGKDVAQ